MPIYLKFKIFVAACALVVCCSASSQAWAQKCKPAFSETDKLSKEKYDVWGVVLSDKGGFMSTSEVGIVATTWRRGNVNYITLRMDRTEESAVKAEFASTLRGVVGRPFYFGFKTGGPLEFEATEVENTGGVQGFFVGKVLTRVSLRSVVSDKALAALREALVSRQIDAVRVVLEGNVRIEASVGDKAGKKMMEQFSCFYQSLDNQGIDLAAAVDRTGQPVQSAPVGEKQGEPQTPAAQLTIDQVIQMVTARLQDDIIITTIRNSGSKFDLTPDALIKLKTVGVSDGVIRAMMTSQPVKDSTPESISEPSATAAGTNMNPTWLDGMWEGAVNQINPKMTYSIKLTARNNRYLVDYPSLSCGGEWALVDKTSGRAKFKEKLSYGLGHCVDDGDIVIERVSDTQIGYKWIERSTVVVANAILTKM